MPAKELVLRSVETCICIFLLLCVCVAHGVGNPMVVHVDSSTSLQQQLVMASEGLCWQIGSPFLQGGVSTAPSISETTTATPMVRSPAPFLIEGRNGDAILGTSQSGRAFSLPSRSGTRTIAADTKNAKSTSVHANPSVPAFPFPKSFSLPRATASMRDVAPKDPEIEKLMSRTDALEDRVNNVKGFFSRLVRISSGIASLLKAGRGTRSPSPAVEEPHRFTAFLDLDHTAIYGTDGNDLGIAFQLGGKSREELKQLYAKLINPSAVDLVEGIRKEQIAAGGGEVGVCIYTRRSHLLRYRSRIRPGLVSVMWEDSWHLSSDKIVIPSNITRADQVMESCSSEVGLTPHEFRDLRMGIERLLAARDALREVLKLDYAPDVVVTATCKDVAETARRLGLSPERACLWDDNAELAGHANVVVVDRYDSMPSEKRKELLEYLEVTLPASSLPERAVEFLLGAREDSSSLMRCEDNSVSYKIREGPALKPFRIPEYVSSPPKTSSPASPSIEACMSMEDSVDKPLDCQAGTMSLSPVPCNSEEPKHVNSVLLNEEAVDRIPRQGVPRVATASEGKRWWERLPSAILRDPHSVLCTGVGKPEPVSRDFVKTVARGLGQESFFLPLQETHNTDHQVL